MHLRPIAWPADAARVRAFDASYRTATIFVPELDGLSMRLREVELAGPPFFFQKTYAPEGLVEAVETAAFAVAAEAEDGALAGFTAVKLEPWNRSAALSALFVAPQVRRRGVGRALLDRALDFARGERMRCLGVETQSTNVPAIRFYQRAGFRFCGVHTDLYDPADAAPAEVAVYFTYTLAAP